MDARFTLRDNFKTILESFETYEEAKKAFDIYILQNKSNFIETEKTYEIYDEIEDRAILVS